jgi:hypothetical protein
MGWGLDGVTVMSGRELQLGVSLLLDVVVILGGALGLGTPMALVIIWLCS